MFSVHDLLQDGRTGAAAVKGGLKSPVSSCGSGSGLTFTCLQLLSEYVELSSSCDRPEPPGSVHTDTLTVYCTVKVRVPDAHRHTERLCCGEAESYLQVLFCSVRFGSVPVFPCVSDSDSVPSPSNTLSHVPLCFRSADTEECGNIPSEQI